MNGSDKPVAVIRSLSRRAAAEAIGTMLLLSAVVGSGSRPFDLPGFIGAQLVGGALAVLVFSWLTTPTLEGDQ